MTDRHTLAYRLNKTPNQFVFTILLFLACTVGQWTAAAATVAVAASHTVSDSELLTTTTVIWLYAMI